MKPRYITQTAKTLVDTYGNISHALRQLRLSDGLKTLSLKQLEDAISEHEILTESVREGIRAKADIAQEKAFEMIQAGDSNAILEMQRLTLQNKTDELGLIKTKVAEILCNTVSSSSEFSRLYLHIFSGTSKSAEKALYKICIEKNILSPAERMKKEAAERENSIAERFDRGELDEIELLKLQLKSALNEMEGASVTGRAQGNKNSLLIQQRLDEIRERNSKTEIDIESISDLMDSHLFGISVEEVKRLTLEYNSLATPKVLLD